MQTKWSRRALVGRVLFAGCAGVVACNSENELNVVTPVPSRAARFVVTRLVADTAGFGAPVIDPLLVNPWGLAFNSAGLLWAANNGTGTATVYTARGAKQPTVVAIPSSTSTTGGAPTGLVFNLSQSFAIGANGRATFIFAGEDGTISAWNTNTGANAVRVVNRSATGAVYKGIAIASISGADFLYATDFHNNRVDVFDGTFQFIRSFTDTTITGGFAPFGIQNIGGVLYVTFAKQDQDRHDDVAGPGNGFVDIFNPNGQLIRHFAANGPLNSPWGVAQATTGFGSLGGAILVGNFGDGTINAFNAADGSFLGPLLDPTNAPIVLPGLWTIVFGPQSTATTLYISSGPGDEKHGLLAVISPQ